MKCNICEKPATCVCSGLDVPAVEFCDDCGKTPPDVDAAVARIEAARDPLCRHCDEHVPHDLEQCRAVNGEADEPRPPADAALSEVVRECLCGHLRSRHTHDGTSCTLCIECGGFDDAKNVARNDSQWSALALAKRILRECNYAEEELTEREQVLAITCIEQDRERVRAEAIEECAKLCERPRCRRWSPEECARQIRSQLARTIAPDGRSLSPAESQDGR